MYQQLDGSGSGKSASYSIPNAYQMLGSYIFTDPKGELYDKTAGYLKSHGYEIKVLNLVRPQLSDGYNPLMHISSELDVDVIANTIVVLLCKTGRTITCVSVHIAKSFFSVTIVIRYTSYTIT